MILVMITDSRTTGLGRQPEPHLGGSSIDDKESSIHNR